MRLFIHSLFLCMIAASAIHGQVAVSSVSFADSLRIERAAIFGLHVILGNLASRSGGPVRLVLEKSFARNSARESLAVLVSDSLVAKQNAKGSSAIRISTTAITVWSDTTATVHLLVLGPKPGQCIGYRNLVVLRDRIWLHNVGLPMPRDCPRD